MIVSIIARSTPSVHRYQPSYEKLYAGITGVSNLTRSSTLLLPVPTMASSTRTVTNVHLRPPPTVLTPSSSGPDLTGTGTSIRTVPVSLQARKKSAEVCTVCRLESAARNSSPLSCLVKGSRLLQGHRPGSS